MIPFNRRSFLIGATGAAAIRLNPVAAGKDQMKNAASARPDPRELDRATGASGG